MGTVKKEKILGSIRRFENIVATKPFQDAMQNLIDDADEIEKAEKNPVEYFSSFGVVIPKGFDLEVRREKPETKKKGTDIKAISITIVVCISWCDKYGCYTYCVRIPLPF